MGFGNILKKTVDVGKKTIKGAKNTSYFAKKEMGPLVDDAKKIGSKMKGILDDSKVAYTMDDFAKETNPVDKSISMLWGYNVPLSSKMGAAVVGGSAIYGVGKTKHDNDVKVADGGGMVLSNRLSSNSGHTKSKRDKREQSQKYEALKNKIDDLGATGDMVFGMHRGR